MQSDNGQEFLNQELVNTMNRLFPGLQIVHGKPQHSQSQGSVERANKDVEKLLACWMTENKSSQWPNALQFIQYKKIPSITVELIENHTQQCLTRNLVLVYKV